MRSCLKKNKTKIQNFNVSLDHIVRSSWRPVWTDLRACLKKEKGRGRLKAKQKTMGRRGKERKEGRKPVA